MFTQTEKETVKTQDQKQLFPTDRSWFSLLHSQSKLTSIKIFGGIHTPRTVVVRVPADLIVAEGHEDLSKEKQRAAGQLIQVTCISNRQRLPQLPLGVMDTAGGEGEEATDIADCTLETLAGDASSVRGHRGHESGKLRIL
jgi:hypothetical protein